MSQDDDGNKQLFKADRVDEDIDYIKGKQVYVPVAKESTSIPLLEDSELDKSTYPGQKASFVGKKRVSSEDDKGNKNTGSKLSPDSHTAVSGSVVKGSAMHLKEVHTAVAQSKKMLLI